MSARIPVIKFGGVTLQGLSRFGPDEERLLDECHRQRNLNEMYRLLAQRRNLARAHRLEEVAEDFIRPLCQSDCTPVVVVSAFDWATDKLEQLAASLSSDPDPREYAHLLMSGELRANAALAIALVEAGLLARSLTGREAGIITDKRPVGALVERVEIDPDREVSLDQPLDLKGLQALLDRQLPSRSLFYILRLEGEFAYVKTRSVPRQHQPYPKLSDVAARQPTFAFENTAGTLVGLFCPYFVNGANLPGYHFHFLNALRTGGGHVLDLRLVRGKLTVDTTPRYLLALPESGPFTAAKLDKANTAEMQKVEQDRK